MKIKNLEQLATTPLRKQALLIAESVFAAIDTKNVIDRIVNYQEAKRLLTIDGKTYDLKKYKQLICIGVGKTAFSAVSALSQKLQGEIACGFVIDLVGGELGNITCRVGSHPYPTEVNVEATLELLKLLDNLTPEDLVLFVISGGGSSLLCLPNKMTCDEEARIIQALTKSGATISDLNTVRKHISSVKGGQLAARCYPADVISLIFSDVPGDDISAVASGPTVKDPTTIADAQAVLNKYEVLKHAGLSHCELKETPKDDKFFDKVHNVLALTAKDAVLAGKEKAQDLGWKVEIYGTDIQGETHELGKKVLAASRAGLCIIGSGETTMKVKRESHNGRCLIMALATLSEVPEKTLFLPLASDGHDHSDAAGAISDQEALKEAKNRGLNVSDFQEIDEGYRFFQEIGALVFTGETGSNVSDFFICLRER